MLWLALRVVGTGANLFDAVALHSESLGPVRAVTAWHVAFSVLLLVGTLGCLALGLARSSWFPMAVCCLFGGHLAFAFAEVGIGMALAGDPSATPGMLSIRTSLVSCFIAIPYVIASRRVANTFSGQMAPRAA